MDAASQQSLRDLNEANWARFEDRVNRGLAEVRSEFRSEIAGVDLRIAAMEARLMGHLGTQMRWMIGIWGAVMLAVIGLWCKR